MLFWWEKVQSCSIYDILECGINYEFENKMVFTVFTVKVFCLLKRDSRFLDTLRNSVSTKLALRGWLLEASLELLLCPFLCRKKNSLQNLGRIHWLQTPHKWKVESFVAKITDTTDHTVVPGTPVFHAVKEAEWKGRPSTRMAKTFKAKLSKTFGSFEQMLGPILGGANPLAYFAGDVFERWLSGSYGKLNGGTVGSDNSLQLHRFVYPFQILRGSSSMARTLEHPCHIGHPTDGVVKKTKLVHFCQRTNQCRLLWPVSRRGKNLTCLCFGTNIREKNVWGRKMKKYGQTWLEEKPAIVVFLYFARQMANY